MTLISELEKFGLVLNEARVYLACLELGPESVQNIAKKAKLNRVTAYGLVGGLIKKGFLREEYMKNKKKISAYSPVKLYDIVTQRENEIKRQVKQLEILVPELKKHANIHQTKTNVIYYEGEEGLKNWASDALEAKGELLEWTKIESFSQRFDKYLQAFYFPEKARRKIPTRFIFLDTPEAREYVQKNYLDNPGAPPMKARFISKDLFDTPGFIAIFNDRYSIALPKEMRAVTVVDETIAHAQRKMWEFGWLHAKDEVSNGKYPKI
jgi:sugar-specific transcriptional regulator TrmB